ncbi:MAG: TIGR03621 family F420-dependent LLM class oxidoreductase [Jatrophihabitantaceae bacterium]
MHLRPLRFGVALMRPAGRAQWQAKCRQAEQLGYDVITVPDFIGGPAPLLALALAAQATERAQVGSYALNCGFHRPPLLARDLVAMIELADGRMEVGLGTGYAEADFEAAGVAWTSPADRLAHLASTVLELQPVLADAATPLLIGGSGRRLLGYAARHADIVSLTGAETRTARGKATLMSCATLADRLHRIRLAAGDRVDRVELNIMVHAVYLTGDVSAAAEFRGNYARHLPEADLPELPSLLCGTEQSIAEDILRFRAALGISYFTVLEPAMADFARVLRQLRSEQ